MTVSYYNVTSYTFINFEFHRNFVPIKIVTLLKNFLRILSASPLEMDMGDDRDKDYYKFKLPL